MLFRSETRPERFTVGSSLDIYLPEAELLVTTTVRWLRPWGERKLSGLGVSFDQTDQQLSEALTILLKSDPENDRDRLVA